MREEKVTIYSLEEDVRIEVNDRLEDLMDSCYPDDILHEIADNNIPIYNYDRVSCLLDDLTLSEPDDPGLCGDSRDIFDILAASIYERLIVEANKEWERIKDKELVCEDCGGEIDDYDAYTESKEKYGVRLCVDCMDERDNPEEEEEENEE